MKEWTGKVTEVKKVPYQDIVLYQFKIEQSQRYFRLGRNEPTFEEGTWIKFTERNSNVDVSTVEVDVQAVPSDSVTPTTSEETKVSSPTTTAGDVGRRLQYQAARADATKLCVAMLNVEGQGVEILPWSKNTAKNKRLDLFMGYVSEVTKTLLEQEATDG